MCWIMVREQGTLVNYDYIEEAYTKNKDGFGVAYIIDDTVEIFKTMSIDIVYGFIEILEDLDIPFVLHLRNNSRGATSLDMCHPFDVGNGSYMFHNGTVCNIGSYTDKESDSFLLADMIKDASIQSFKGAEKLLQTIVGTTKNRLVFVSPKEGIVIINKELGVEEDGIWYSNTYHIDTTTTTNTYPATTYYSTIEELNKTDTNNVFVYGTLKRGGYNDYILSDSEFVGEAVTCKKYDMIGKDSGFPYLLQENKDGLNIKGEMYRVSDEIVDRLDTLEGYPTHYTKQLIKVKVGSKYYSCWTYFKAKVDKYDLAEEKIDEFKV